MATTVRPTWRRLVAYAFGALVLLLARPRLELYVPGVFLCLLGESLRIWGCGHLRKNKRLTRTGPYAHVRHPLYVGTLLIVVGLALASGSIWALAVVLPVALAITFLYYLPRKDRNEGDRLERRFGDEFREYRKAVPALLPRIRPWPGRGPERWSFPLVRENSEIGAALAVLAGLAIIAIGFFVDLGLIL